MKRACPICSDKKKKIIFHQCFNNKVISLMSKYDVVVCNTCGFIYADNIPSQKDFNNYYAIRSKYEFGYKKGNVSKDYLDHFKKIADFIKDSLKSKDAKILDIGCSTGALLHVLKSRGFNNLLGIDPSESCAKTVRKLHGIKAVASNIGSFKSKDKFDLIVMSAVLEHLVDFDNSMTKIYSLLNDEGLLFLEVPDAERFFSYACTPFQQFSIEHINYFSKHSIKSLLLKFGFKVIKIENNENRINESIDPDIFILATKCAKSGFKFVKDRVTSLKIRKYINLSGKIDSRVKSAIQNRLPKDKKVIVWGVGTHTQRLIGSGLDISKILYFVDSNERYKGKRIKGLVIKAPGEIIEDNPILISSYSYQNEIAEQIKDVLRLNNKVLKIY